MSDNVSQSLAKKQLEALGFNEIPKSKYYAAAVDIGFKNLAIAVGYCRGQMPKFSARWKPSELMKGGAQPPFKILGAFRLNLVANPEKNEPGIKCFIDEELEDLVDNINPQLSERLDKMREWLLTNIIDAQQFVNALTTEDQKQLYMRLEFIHDYELSTESGQNLTKQLVNYLLDPLMRWIWACPTMFFFENQVDHLEGKRHNPNGPLNQVISHVMQGIIGTVDKLIFGVQRGMRFTAKKYGFEDDQLIIKTKEANPRCSDEYTLRKRCSITGLKTLLHAYGLQESDLYHFVFIDNKDKPDDLCDAILMVLNVFFVALRTTEYNVLDKQKIEEDKQRAEEKNKRGIVIKKRKRIEKTKRTESDDDDDDFLDDEEVMNLKSPKYPGSSLNKRQKKGPMAKSSAAAATKQKKEKGLKEKKKKNQKQLEFMPLTPSVAQLKPSQYIRTIASAATTTTTTRTPPPPNTPNKKRKLIVVDSDEEDSDDLFFAKYDNYEFDDEEAEQALESVHQNRRTGPVFSSTPITTKQQHHKRGGEGEGGGDNDDYGKRSLRDLQTTDWD